MSSFRSPCTCFHLRRATRRVTQIYDRELAAVELSLNQYSILRRAGESPRTLGSLADELGMDRTTLTRNLKPLLVAGLLAETRGEDARQRLLQLSDAGRRRLASARPHWQRAQGVIEEAFSADAVARLHADLDTLTERLHAHEAAQ
ncbi:MarR family winged helix-turn-helix transcriptional regulator [Pseudoxanthomonas sp. z9]|uniref:MarR family winged helix-turn-helix transcriptional regulator n=1 Tax=Pseudoxanthomonas sp. z9 TaxID=2584942 RepID=UPI001141773E|nr:MarR family winged helix-turn-helix transcriptional regulator [Pseudoxanthomonas sp. z9]